MSEQETTVPAAEFPADWQIEDYDPSVHKMNLKGKDYLNVQQRLKWFTRDQRRFIMLRLAAIPYQITTDCVELDRERGFAHFRTYVRDVLGNEATMYGSETAKDFGDYAEKASTKSLGRALAALGYGTENADDDEGKVGRPVDAPVTSRSSTSRPPAQTSTAPQQQQTARAPVPIRPAVVMPEDSASQSAPPPAAQVAAAAHVIHERDQQSADAASQRVLALKLRTYFGADETGEYKALRAWLHGQLRREVSGDDLRALGKGELDVTHKAVSDATAHLSALMAEEQSGEDGTQALAAGAHGSGKR